MTAQEIDREIKGIVMQCYEKAKDILQKNVDILHQLAKTLLERESLSGNDIDEIIHGKALA